MVYGCYELSNGIEDRSNILFVEKSPGKCCLGFHSFCYFFSRKQSQCQLFLSESPYVGMWEGGEWEEVYSKFVALKITCFSFVINRKHSHGRKFGKYKSLKRRK